MSFEGDIIEKRAHIITNYMNPTKNRKGLPKRLGETLTNEVKRLLVRRCGCPQVVSVGHFGRHSFRIQSGVEAFRTMDYGDEPEALAAFLFLLHKDDVVWDIGASVGLFTVHAAERVRQIVSFEPDPSTLVRLRENVTLNGLDDKVLCHGMALGAEKGTLTLATDGLSGNAPTLSDKGGGGHKNRVEVAVETIDGLIGSGEPVPTVMKIDIEGAEILALRGARNLLNGPCRPRLLFLELHPTFLPHFGSNANEVLTRISNSGYTVVSSQPRHDQQHVIAVISTN